MLFVDMAKSTKLHSDINSQLNYDIQELLHPAQSYEPVKKRHPENSTHKISFLSNQEKTNLDANPWSKEQFVHTDEFNLDLHYNQQKKDRSS